MNDPNHIPEEQITAYILGELSGDEATEMEKQLEESADCRAFAQEIESTLDLLRSALAEPSEAPATIDRTGWSERLVSETRLAETVPEQSEPEEPPVETSANTKPSGGLLLWFRDAYKPMVNVAALLMVVLVTGIVVLPRIFSPEGASESDLIKSHVSNNSQVVDEEMTGSSDYGMIQDRYADRKDIPTDRVTTGDFKTDPSGAKDGFGLSLANQSETIVDDYINGEKMIEKRPFPGDPSARTPNRTPGTKSSEQVEWSRPGAAKSKPTKLAVKPDDLHEFRNAPGFLAGGAGGGAPTAPMQAPPASALTPRTYLAPAAELAKQTETKNKKYTADLDSNGRTTPQRTPPPAVRRAQVPPTVPEPAPVVTRSPQPRPDAQPVGSDELLALKQQSTHAEALDLAAVIAGDADLSPVNGGNTQAPAAETMSLKGFYETGKSGTEAKHRDQKDLEGKLAKGERAREDYRESNTVTADIEGGATHASAAFADAIGLGPQPTGPETLPDLIEASPKKVRGNVDQPFTDNPLAAGAESLHDDDGRRRFPTAGNESTPGGEGRSDGLLAGRAQDEERSSERSKRKTLAKGLSEKAAGTPQPGTTTWRGKVVSRDTRASGSLRSRELARPLAEGQTEALREQEVAVAAKEILERIQGPVTEGDAFGNGRNGVRSGWTKNATLSSETASPNPYASTIDELAAQRAGVADKESHLNLNGVLEDVQDATVDAIELESPVAPEEKDAEFLEELNLEQKKRAEESVRREKEDPGVFQAHSFNPYVQTAEQKFSTFSIDCDTAAYTMTRSYMNQGSLPPAEAVRTEEFINFFDYHYGPPKNDTFSIYNQVAPSPFGSGYVLKTGIKARRIGRDQQRPARLTFVIDTSGSMDTESRLGLARKSLGLLVEKLAPTDQVAIIQYDFTSRLVLQHTAASEKQKILDALSNMQISGSTHLEQGIQLGYETAAKAFEAGAVNRVLLLSDGMANLGASEASEILGRVAQYRKQGIYLSVFGFGIGKYNDVMLESLADKGNGTYQFIDSLDEAKRVFVDDLAATLNTVARDVKIQVEFNPRRVVRYRQLGYENRQLKQEQFRDDTVDAGEVGSGQSVTALYELDFSPATREPIGVVRVRYHDADTGEVREIQKDIRPGDLVHDYQRTDAHFKLATCVAEFGEILRGSPFAQGSDFATVAKHLRPVALDLQIDPRIPELLRLVQSAEGMPRATP